MTAVRILGVDPGSRYTGYGLIESDKGKSRWLAAGRLDVREGARAERLLAVMTGLADVIREHAPHEAAVE